LSSKKDTIFLFPREILFKNLARNLQLIFKERILRKGEAMKNKRIWLRIGGLGLLALMVSCVIYIPYEEGPARKQEPYNPPEVGERPHQVKLSFVFDYLSPYGYWIYLSPYGHVWVPRQVSFRWRPYTYGRWVWTDFGWLWVSNYEWGWLTFHYGRWGWHERIGWFWVPGTVWAPAWVIWTWGELYIGWAPIPPDVEWVPGVGFSVWRLEPLPQTWVFVEGRYFTTDYLDRYLLPVERNRTVLNFVVNKRSLAAKGATIYNEGVAPELIQKWTKLEIRKYEIKPTWRPTREVITPSGVTVHMPEIIKDELAKPKEIVDPEKVHEQLSRERIPATRWQELELERRALERSQREEESYLQRKMEEEKNQALDPKVKQEVESRYQIQLEQLKKQHQEEKSELTRRQEEEKKKISGEPVRKKKEKINS